MFLKVLTHYRFFLLDLFSVPYNVFPNLGYLADFMIVQLGFSKRATLNLLSVLSTSFIFAKVRLITRFHFSPIIEHF